MGPDPTLLYVKSCATPRGVFNPHGGYSGGFKVMGGVTEHHTMDPRLAREMRRAPTQANFPGTKIEIIPHPAMLAEGWLDTIYDLLMGVQGWKTAAWPPVETRPCRISIILGGCKFYYSSPVLFWVCFRSSVTLVVLHSGRYVLCEFICLNSFFPLSSSCKRTPTCTTHRLTTDTPARARRPRAHPSSVSERLRE